MRAKALEALVLAEPSSKVAAARALDAASLSIDLDWSAEAPAGIPGRPARPELVAPSQVRSRSVHSLEGRAALIHSIAHIEFNAINLALDIIWRFGGMPEAFYRDWALVAKEEADHFLLLVAHLRTMGFEYGDFPAHDGLWEMAERTTDDILARLALVPRTLEARGLDASPAIRDRLAQVGDDRGARILDTILRDEIGHVSIGNKWYGYLCEQRGLDPIAIYREMARHYRAPRLRGPFNVDARLEAGFSRAEIDALLG